MADDESRHYRNPYDISIAPPDGSLPPASFTKNLVDALFAQRRVSDQSVYTGRLGVDILSLRYNGNLNASNTFAKNSFTRKESFFTGYAGYLAVKIAAGATERVEKLLQIAKANGRNSWEAEELLYGRAGWLAAVGFVLNYQPHIIRSPGLQEELIVQLFCLYVSGTKGKSDGIMHYSWHSKNYLGAAHGLSGILQTFLAYRYFWPQVESMGKLTPGTVETTIRNTVANVLEEYTFSTGNIQSSAGNTKDRLVHWCHGAPGWVATAIALDLREVAEKLGRVVWERGLLKKGVGLCHGISGNGYCFLQLFQYTGEKKWLNAAKYFAIFGRQKYDELKDLPDRPNSLYEGAIGFALFLLDLRNPEQAKFPGMEFTQLKFN